MDTAKYLAHLHTCEKCFLDILDQIKAGNRFKLKGLNELDSYEQDSCDCDCCCFDECTCSECEDNGCEQECDCECTCKETCKCVFGEHLTFACKHNNQILIKLQNLRARILSDSKTHLLTNNIRRKLLEAIPCLPKKKEEIKGKQGSQRFIYFYFD